MLRRFLVIILLLGMSATPVAAELSYLDYTWQVIGKGLEFTRLEVLDNKEVVESLTVVRIDPNLNAFRIYHGSPQRLQSWQEQTDALVLFNGSYFTKDWQPCGLVVSDGRFYGPRRNASMRGMFVAEPRGMSPDLPRATILDLVANPVELAKLPWSQGLMSFPLLLDSRGRIRVKKTDLRSHRTVVATDRQGNILVIHTAGDYFTLYELARFLKASSLEIDTALNLDGGAKAQLAIKTPEFSLVAPSLLEQSARDLFDEQASLLPTVIGVFPRQE
ncbi:MAG: phosphodiester glycosidase family protein [Desulfobacca sp.]|uniref:phosphodiester glycosidase family protein n=1 Tax=Desulfobacca sp. TaxID=2067990 RepID=UPI00404B5CEF